MAGYVIGQIKEFKNTDGFGAYQGAAGPTAAQYGGKLVLNITKIESGDGGWDPAGMVVIEFESVEQAKNGTTPQSTKRSSDSGSIPPTAH